MPHKTRTGSVTVPRGHVETLEDGSEVKLGVWIMMSPAGPFCSDRALLHTLRPGYREEWLP